MPEMYLRRSRRIPEGIEAEENIQKMKFNY
jgi:hypothetical protein